jgi:capsular exopolysaccharide synthesis family protein
VGVTYQPGTVQRDWLRSSARVLLNGVIPIVVFAVIGGLLGWAYSLVERPTYESSAVIYQTPMTGDSDSVSKQRSEAYTELLTSERLITSALKSSGINMSVDDVKKATSAGANSGSAILTVTTRTDDPETSAKLANALADTLPKIVGELDGSRPLEVALPPLPGVAPTAELNPDGTPVIPPVEVVPTEVPTGQLNPDGTPVEVVPTEVPTGQLNPDGTPVEVVPTEVPTGQQPPADQPIGAPVPVPTAADQVRLSVITPAVASVAKAAPSFVLNISVGLVAGLLLGMFFAYLRARLTRKVQDDVELSDFLSGPLLASIPVNKAVKKSGVVDFRHRDSTAAEAFRRLRTSISGSDLLDSDSRRIVVTSPGDGDGKTIAAVNLAIALAANGSHVVLVDAALPTIGAKARGPAHPVGDVDGAPGGLVGYIENGGDITAYALDSRHARLAVIPAGGPVVNPSELLGTPRMRAGLDELAGQFDYVIVDTASMDARSDAIVLARSANAVMVLARSNKTRYIDLSASLQRFEAADIPLIGLVLNGYPKSWPFGRRRRNSLSVAQILAVKPAQASNVAFLNERPPAAERDQSRSAVGHNG